MEERPTLTNREMYDYVKGKVSSYLTDNNATLRLLFYDQLLNYCKEIGLSNVLDLILPVLSKIVFT